MSESESGSNSRNAIYIKYISGNGKVQTKVGQICINNCYKLFGNYDIVTCLRVNWPIFLL